MDYIDAAIYWAVIIACCGVLVAGVLFVADLARAAWTDWQAARRCERCEMRMDPCCEAWERIVEGGQR